MTELPERVRFQQRDEDANGDRLGAWGSDGEVTVAASLGRRLRGEAVLQARLQGQTPAIVRVWSSAATRAITSAWRVTDLRTGQNFALKSRGQPTEDRDYLDFEVLDDGSANDA